MAWCSWARRPWWRRWAWPVSAGSGRYSWTVRPRRQRRALLPAVWCWRRRPCWPDARRWNRPSSRNSCRLRAGRRRCRRRMSRPPSMRLARSSDGGRPTDSPRRPEKTRKRRRRRHMYEDDEFEIRNADMGDDDDFRNATYDRRTTPWQPGPGGIVRRPVVAPGTGPRVPNPWYNPPTGYPLPGYGQTVPGQMQPGYPLLPPTTPCGSAGYYVRPMNVGKVLALVGVIVDVVGQGVAAILPLPG